MADGPAEFGDKLDKVTGAWEQLRPAKKFSNMTLDEFKAKTKASRDARARIIELETELSAEQTKRDTADIESAKIVEFVVSSVKGDPDEGPDGELYEGFGYVRKSQRKTGLTRKKKPPTP